jgi:hypothetical protein
MPIRLPRSAKHTHVCLPRFWAPVGTAQLAPACRRRRDGGCSPGATQKVLQPRRHSSSTSRRAHRALTLGQAASGGTPCSSRSYCRTFRSSSAHSWAVSEPRTMPTPANSDTRVASAGGASTAAACVAAAPPLLPAPGDCGPGPAAAWLARRSCSCSSAAAAVAALPPGCTSAERMATANSAAPWLTQPKGAA